MDRAWRGLAPAAMLAVVVACAETPAENDGDGDGGTSTSGGASSTGGESGSMNGGASGSPTGGVSPTGGGGSFTNGGASPTGGDGGSTHGGVSGSPTGGASATGGASTTGGAGGSANGGSTNGGAGSPGGSTNGGASGGSGGSGGPPNGMLTLSPADGLFTGVRYWTSGVPTNRTNGPQLGPTQTFRIHNASSAAASVTASLSGTDAARFEITAPSSFPLSVPANGDTDVTLRVVTANAALGTAPMQDSGATVLEATLTATAGSATTRSRLYALVLTYVEFEPTFGQILSAFPEYTSMLPNSIRNDANPNPSSLPGVEAGTDEVRAPVFRRADAARPVTLRALGRFSPPGLVPFGWYRPGTIGTRTTVGTLGQATDPHTNDKSRMLLPPLASGSASFEPSEATFGLFMTPAGVGLLATEDAQGFDGAHRVKVWTLRDASGAVRPNEYLLGGEEAANGDYQDYVFVVTNVVPTP